jgi:hypothetical protein
VQLLYREVNEQIRSVGTGLFAIAADEELELICECLRLGCTERIALTPADYERVRERPARFVVLPGHEEDELEYVVERHPSYLVVEKKAELFARVTEGDHAEDCAGERPAEAGLPA